MANAVDFASAGRPALNSPRRRVRSQDHGPVPLLRALKSSSSALRMRVSWQTPRLLYICRPDREHALPFAIGTRSE
jgi:hypothetical protein